MSSFWTVGFGGIFEYFHAAAGNIDLSACITLAVGTLFVKDFKRMLYRYSKKRDVSPLAAKA